MGTLYNFTRLINKYISSFTAVTLENGYYDDCGDWVNGDLKKTPLKGAIINHKEIRVFRSGGALSEKDKRLFMFEPIDDKLQGAKVIYDGCIYSISDCAENAKFTGVYAYTLKYISAFKDFPPDYDLTEVLEKLKNRLDGVQKTSVNPPPPESITEETEKLEKRLGGEKID